MLKEYESQHVTSKDIGDFEMGNSFRGMSKALIFLDSNMANEWDSSISKEVDYKQAKCHGINVLHSKPVWHLDNLC